MLCSYEQNKENLLKVRTPHRLTSGTWFSTKRNTIKEWLNHAKNAFSVELMQRVGGCSVTLENGGVIRREMAAY